MNNGGRLNFFHAYQKNSDLYIHTGYKPHIFLVLFYLLFSLEQIWVKPQYIGIIGGIFILCLIVYLFRNFIFYLSIKIQNSSVIFLLYYLSLLCGIFLLFLSSLILLIFKTYSLISVVAMGATLGYSLPIILKLNKINLDITFQMPFFFNSMRIKSFRINGIQCVLYDSLVTDDGYGSHQMLFLIGEDLKIPLFTNIGFFGKRVKKNGYIISSYFHVPFFIKEINDDYRKEIKISSTLNSEDSEIEFEYSSFFRNSPQPSLSQPNSQQFIEGLYKRDRIDETLFLFLWLIFFFYLLLNKFNIIG